MLRFQCPKCEKKLGAPEEKAGGVAVCPGCKTKIRIPQPRPGGTQRPARPAPRPVQDDDDLAPPVRRRRPRPPEDDEGPVLDDETDEELPPKRKKKRRKRKKKRRGAVAELLFGGDGLTVALIGVAALGLLCLGVSFVWPPAAWAALGLGWIMSMIGGLWFLVVAFQDSPMEGILCLLIPFYSLYYLLKNFEETKQPFFVQLAGIVLLGIASCAGAASA